MRPIGVILSALGIILLVVSMLGHWGGFGGYENAPPRQWESFDSELARSLDSYPLLMGYAQEQLPDSATEREMMSVLYGLVAKRFTHKEASHTFFSNWILYTMGVLHPAFSHIRDVEVMVKNGHSLFCGQSSYILLQMALDQGIKARHVGLDGHVVMEAWYDGDWHLYDPDLEVLPLDDEGRVLSVEELAQDAALLDKYYGPHRVTEIVATRENNTYMSYPEGALFEWKSNLLAHFEQAMEVLKFILPLGMIILGLVFIKRANKINHS